MKLNDFHSKKIDISEFGNRTIEYKLVAITDDGKEYFSENYEVSIEANLNDEENNNFWGNCLLGGAVFLLPSPVYAIWDGFNVIGGIPKNFPFFLLPKDLLVFIPYGYFALSILIY